MLQIAWRGVSRGKWLQGPALVHVSLPTRGFFIKPSENNQYIDKTSHVADLINAHPRVYFARPRCFGKYVILGTAERMLAAGELPPGVIPWPGYEPVDTVGLFGGLEVHKRLLRGDPTLGKLLRHPHFVIQLSLGGAMGGKNYSTAIKHQLESYADRRGAGEGAFGEALLARMRKQSTCKGALGELIAAVPEEIPVALLVFEYDAEITEDVSKGDWASAKAGQEALLSLTQATQSHEYGHRIERCLMTGVTRLGTALADGFSDFTRHPILSKAMGISEEEILTTFPGELKRLAASEGKSEASILGTLRKWYGGYSFDGQTTVFNPHAVRTTLRNGTLGRPLHKIMQKSRYILLQRDIASVIQALSRPCADDREVNAWMPLILRGGK